MQVQLFQIEFADIKVLLVRNVDGAFLVDRNAPAFERHGRSETGLYERRRGAGSEYRSDISVGVYFA